MGIVNVLLGIFMVAVLEKIIKESKRLTKGASKSKDYQEITYESLEKDYQYSFEYENNYVDANRHDEDIEYELGENFFEDWEISPEIEENAVEEMEIPLNLEPMNHSSNEQNRRKFHRRNLKKAVIYKEIIDRPLGVRKFKKIIEK